MLDICLQQTTSAGDIFRYIFSWCFLNELKIMMKRFHLKTNDSHCYKKISEYDQEMPESQTADQPTTPWGGDRVYTILKKRNQLWVWHKEAHHKTRANWNAVDGTPSQKPAFSLLTLTVGSWLHQILPSTLHTMWPMDLGTMKWLCQTGKEMNLKEKTFFDLDLGIKVTLNIAQHPLHHVTFSPAKI